jgi:hypothetical protein
VYNKPAEQEEDNDSCPKNPLILLGSPFNHTNSIATDTQRIGYAVQSFLRPLEHLSLLTEVAQDSPTSIQEFVKLVGCVLEEGVFAKHVTFTVVTSTLLGTG